ncbi:hypothetical protein AYO44_01090 [Planctomycetaceae bacterium SCGC AG-212-F19]|nr:hypothetical protein AYO44_01090 [Planctomycetaceae bacterium SCGC AG-212-F19]
MTVPARLEDWTYEAVDRLCQTGQVESDRHDFKANLPESDTLSKICCAFANSQGGFVVVGVSEPKSGTRFLPEGIPPDVDIALKFGHKLRAHPTVHFDVPRPVPIPVSSKLIYVFHVPLSSERPHWPMNPEIQRFWKRTNTGCDPMTHEEIRGQFLRYEERRDKLKLLFLELLLNQEALEGYDKQGPNSYTLVTLETSTLDRLLVDTYSLIQDHRDLVAILLFLRGQVTVVKNEARIFFAQIAMPLTNHGPLVEGHNAFLRKKASELLPVVRKGIEMLTANFGLTNPLEEKPT